jgi:hypothetical protein
MLGGLEAPAGAAPAPPAVDTLPSAQRAPVPARPSEPEVEPEWTVALTDDQHEEMRTAEVVQLYARGSIDQETFIWADGMEDWKRPWEIPMIAAELSARGLAPKPDDDDDDDMPMDEPHEDEATIVATMAALAPPSSRGRVPSGMWHEPGRDVDDDVGFDEVTVSLDSKSAQGLIASLGGPRPPHKSNAEILAAQFDDVPTQIHEESAAPPGAPTTDVDDLLSYMEDRTLAMEDSFRAESRPMSAADLLGDEDTTLEQRSLPSAIGDSFSLDTLMAGTGASTSGEAADLFAGVDLPAGRDQPLDSLWEPTGIQPPASNPMSSPGAMPSSGAYAAPASMPRPPEPKQRSSMGCVLVVLLVALVVGGAAAASFFFKQPASLYGPDGMPKIPGLSR